jgi:hypothetical protein
MKTSIECIFLCLVTARWLFKWQQMNFRLEKHLFTRFWRRI